MLTGLCEEGWVRFNNRCYMVMEENKTLTDARDSCKEFGATLATIASDDENNFLHSLQVDYCMHNKLIAINESKELVW